MKKNPNTIDVHVIHSTQLIIFDACQMAKSGNTSVDYYESLCKAIGTSGVHQVLLVQPPPKNSAGLSNPPPPSPLHDGGGGLWYVHWYKIW